MSTAELKIQIFRELDTFNNTKLKEFYGVMQRFIQSKKEDDYIGLTSNEIEGIEDAIVELKAGKGIPHEDVMNEMRKKYSNA